MQSIIQGAEAYEKHPFPSAPSPSSQYTFSSLPKGLHRCEQVPPPILTWSQSLSCWDHFPPAMHWKVAFCPTFTSTFWSRRKWGAFPKREAKKQMKTEFDSLTAFLSVDGSSGWTLGGHICAWEMAWLSEELLWIDYLQWARYCSKTFTCITLLKTHRKSTRWAVTPF